MPIAGKEGALRILVPSIVDPEVSRGGAWTATRGMLKLLGQGPWQAKIECVATGDRSEWRHRLRQATCVLRSTVSSLPSKALFAYNRPMLKKIQRLVREEKFDLIILNGSDLLWMLPELPLSVPRVLFAHNIEYLLYSKQIESVATRWMFGLPLLSRDLLRLRDYEMAGLREIGNAFFLSSIDETTAQNLVPTLNSMVIPPVFDYVPHQRGPTRKDTSVLEVGFMANFRWWPNREGLRWFLANVFPALYRQVRLHLFGQYSEGVEHAHPQIVKHGFVPKLDEVYKLCDVMICPILSGGGVCVKLAEAVYNRMPILSTSFGARGLPLQPDPGIVLLDRAEDWIEFLGSPQARELREHSVSEHCAKPFTVERNATAMHGFLTEICSPNTRLRTPEA